MCADGHEIAERSLEVPISEVYDVVREEHSRALPLLTEIEQHQIAAWNATQQDYPRDVCVPQLVARQAAATPEAVALAAGDQTCTYRELNRRANQVAHYLQTLGVQPGVLVGLCVERSFDMVVGLLGILKAGGAYVPLDPGYPPDRLAFMLSDTQAPVLVTQQRLISRLPSGEARVVLLDTDTAVLAQQSEAEPVLSATASDLAYVIYTSGSTGRPKGVQITHESLLNLLFWHHRAFAVTPSDRATQLTSPAFDATGWELWPYLTAGASVYLLDEESRVVPELCRDFLLSHDISITFLPTALAESVMALEWPSTTSLRYLLTGADALHHYPSPSLPFALINNYGPTEATVVATFGRVFPTECVAIPPSIGRPIANTQIYLLDEHLRQVPIGTPGELCIGGAGLAKGYLNQPELTAEKFIPHPWSSEPGAHLYKTGDLARYLPDGQIAFMGRIDHQVKIRGYRIEPDEIMSVLNEQPAVRMSLVIAREDTPGDKRLVAYVVPVPGAHITAGFLREMLVKRLPDYMVPATFVQLESLLLTPNGKVDRTALPAPDATNTLRDSALVAPTTSLEEWLAVMVATILELEQVGIDDNFFVLGGHSLLATQIILQVIDAFGVNLPLRTLFEAPTVRQLAREIERRIVGGLESISDDEFQRLPQ